MNVFSVALMSAAVGALIGLAIADFHEAMQGVEVEPVAVESPCDPKRTQVLRMDNAERLTQVLDRNVNCVVVMRWNSAPRGEK